MGTWRRCASQPRTCRCPAAQVWATRPRCSRILRRHPSCRRAPFPFPLRLAPRQERTTRRRGTSNPALRLARPAAHPRGLNTALTRARPPMGPRAVATATRGTTLTLRVFRSRTHPRGSLKLSLYGKRACAARLKLRSPLVSSMAQGLGHSTRSGRTPIPSRPPVRGRRRGVTTPTTLPSSRHSPLPRPFAFPKPGHLLRRLDPTFTL